ncbi:MAG: HPr family phosphocarrier protein [Firmicutes bacterium]|nr:HPr family phosphocarrier protein [Bacillota bacterium]MCL2255735.1 HPr family phosphocarrier protein [Bacillota bacterium]
MKKTIQVSLLQAQHVKEFVNIVSKYPFEVDLKSGRFVIDAKSILGIFSLDLSKPITLDIYSDKCDDLIKELKPYTV